MNKKIILAIVNPDDAEHVMTALVAHQYPATRMTSAGGFLRRSSMTLIVGVEEGDVNSALDVIRFACQSEPQPDQHRATLFVLGSASFDHF
jgi:uncharacterized protein YaaQ